MYERQHGSYLKECTFVVCAYEPAESDNETIQRTCLCQFLLLFCFVFGEMLEYNIARDTDLCQLSIAAGCTM